MTRRTLTDELNSVLREHSLQAPEAADTVDRILADTVGTRSADGNGTGDGSGAIGDLRIGNARRWRPSGPSLVAASVVAVLVLAAIGINTARRQPGRQTTTGAVAGSGSNLQPSGALNGKGPRLASQAPGQADGLPVPPTTLPSYVGSLNCSKIPGGHLEVGARAGVRLAATGEVRYVYEYRCVGTNGQRSGSEVQVFKPVGGLLKYVQTLAVTNEHVDAIIGGIDSMRIQSSVPYLMSGVVPDAVQVTTFQFDLGDLIGTGTIIATPCARKDVTVTLSSRAGSGLSGVKQSWLLAVVNRTSVQCALEGYPRLQAAQDGKLLGSQFRQTLSGTAGGVTKSSVPPIIVLKPGASAAAVIEAAVPAPFNSCVAGSQLAVTLPNGASLGTLAASLASCGLVVHPLVGNASGSD